MAVLAAETGFMEEARAWFGEATRTKEGARCAALWHAWALAEARSGEKTAVRYLFGRGLEANPRSRYVFLSWALWEDAQGQPGNARSLFERGHELNPRDAPLLQAWARFEAARGSVEQARDLFERASRADPRHLPVWQAWGLLEARTGDAARARELVASLRPRAAALSAAVEASLISRRGGSSNNSSKNASSPPLLLAVRSSAAAEDLAGASAAGLYDSVLGVDPRDANQLGDAVAAVWASLFSRRAVLARRGARLVPSKDYAAMAVIVQEMAPAALSFVLHTRAPGGGSGGGGEEEEKKTKELLAAEVAVGAGEALASAERGSPWRLSVDRATGAVEVSSFANLSRALLPSSSGNASLSWRCVDYSRQPLSLDPAARERLARKLLAAGLALEASFGGPQDVEGCLPAGLEEEGRIWIVQARPQPGA